MNNVSKVGLIGLIICLVLIPITISSIEEDVCNMQKYEYINLTYPVTLEFGFGQYDIGCPEYNKNKFRWGSVFSRW